MAVVTFMAAASLAGVHSCASAGAAADVENGFENGVSAAFAFRAGQNIVIAGGCNFPADPLAPDSPKKYYRGIYTVDSTGSVIQRVGSLPAAMAYGAAVPLADGSVALVGGADAGGSLSEVWRLRVDSCGVDITPLPELPFTADNMAACALGDRVFVAGGNIDGVPGRLLLMLDLGKGNRKWTIISEMPGNARLQPVIGAWSDGGGDERLYVWGGFAPRHGGNEPTLETDGLCYELNIGQWRHVDGPVAPDGEEISLGGGAACSLPDGRIAVAGGVNKNIFLEALRNQATDYLLHPPSWYHLNGRTAVFDPAVESWTVSHCDEATARAGAAMVTDGGTGAYLIGGELKPRIRTPRITHVKF